MGRHRCTILLAVMLAIGPSIASASSTPPRLERGSKEMGLDRPVRSEAALRIGLSPSRIGRVSAGVELAGMNPVTPTRILDTRIGLGSAASPVRPGSSIAVRVLGEGGVPVSGVEAVAINVTVTEPTAPSFVTVWPTGSPRPETSSLNMLPGQTTPNLVISKVGADGAISMYNAFGSTHLVADVVGWSGTSGHLRALQPDRVLDTRASIGVPGTIPVGPDSSIEIALAGRSGLPEHGVGAVVLNVTVTGATEPSFITVWPSGQPRPLASSLITLPGETNPNLVISRVGPGGRVSLYNAFGSSHLVADVVGFVPSGGAYVPINPTRILDTRTGFGTYGNVMVDEELGFSFLRPRQLDFRTWLNENDTVQLDVGQSLQLPEAASVLVVNVTATEASAPTFVTTWAFGDAQPGTSTLNVLPGQAVPNLALVEVGDDGYVNLFNRFGHVDLIVDVVGYFVARNVDDAIDEIDGSQIHVVHVIPSDVSTPSFDEQAVVHTIDVAESWLEQHGDRGFRFDLSAGTTEISRLRTSLTSDEIAMQANNDVDALARRLIADGYGDTSKIYLVYADGVDAGSLCGLNVGGHAWPEFSLVFAGSCSPNAGYRPDSTGDWQHLGAARVTVHELLHAMGASSSCGRDASFGGHVGDPRDIMYPTDRTDGTGAAVAGAASVLDAGNDDYWGRSYSDCNGEPVADVASSPFLDNPRR